MIRSESENSSPGKDALVTLAFQASRLFLRQPLFRDQRIKLWDRFVRPYVIWRNNVYWGTTSFGGRFECSLRDAVQQKILYFGIWEPNLTSFIEGRLRPGDCFVDVGANIGYFAVLASKLVGEHGKVVAFEASPRIFERLARHKRLNGCANIRIENVAVAGDKGTLPIFSGPDWNSGATSTLSSRGEGFECSVPADRLDRLLTGDELARTRLIKIDVEGAEAPILKSIVEMAEVLPIDCEIVAEVSPEECEQFGETAAGLIESFRAAGFHAYRMDNDYSATAYLVRSSPIRPTRLRAPPREQTDIVFSRLDGEFL